MKKKLMTNSLRETLWGWVFVSLWVVGFLVFTCYPLCRTFALSFNKVTITAEGIVTEAVGGAHGIHSDGIHAAAIHNGGEIKFHSAVLLCMFSGNIIENSRRKYNPGKKKELP